MIPAIVLATHTMGLGVIRALGMMGVPIVAVFYNDKDMGYVSRYVIERVFSPHPEKDEEFFLRLLIHISKKYPESLLIPVSDETLGVVSRNKKCLEEYFHVACTEWEITQKCLEKKLTYQLAEQIGVPVPNTHIPSHPEELAQISKHIIYPCLIKPVVSHRFFEVFKKKMVEVGSSEELIRVYQGANQADLEVLIQEIVPGEDDDVVNYNAYFWNGRPCTEFTAQQIRKAPPHFGSPCVVMSKKIPQVIESGRNLLRALGFSGYACLEFKLDARDETYKLMEVNARHNLSTLLAVRCGINFPWLHYKHLVHGELPEPHGYVTGTYWIDLERDLAYARKNLSFQPSLIRFLRPYLQSHVMAVFDIRDPKPFLQRIASRYPSKINKREYVTDFQSLYP